MALPIVISLRGDSENVTFAVAIFRKSIKKRNYQVIYKTDTKNQAKRLRVTAFAIWDTPSLRWKF